MDKRRSTVKLLTIIFAVCLTALLLGSATTWQYIQARGIEYLERGHQIRRHNLIMEGHGGNPWQYRVLAPFMVDYLIRFFRSLNTPYHLATSFILFRVVQDTAIFILSYVYYRKLGSSRWMTFLGMLILAFGMGTSHYDSDFQFNTFFDVIFYLLAGLAILDRRLWLVVPITILAAFNRETSGLIPVMVLAATVLSKGILPWKRGVGVAVLCLVVYAAIWKCLRVIYPGQAVIVAYDHPPGLPLLWYNISRSVTWINLAYTLNLAPFISLFGVWYSRFELKAFFIAIVPIWFVVHALSSVMAETRLFLVPLAIVFVPATLAAISQVTKIISPYLSGALFSLTARSRSV